MKKTAAIILAVTLILCMIPSIVFADGEIIQNTNTNTAYTDIYTAINAASAGDTLQLLDNVTTTTSYYSNTLKNITLDLNGYRIDVTGQRFLSGTTSSKDYTITVKNGTISNENYATSGQFNAFFYLRGGSTLNLDNMTIIDKAPYTNTEFGILAASMNSHNDVTIRNTTFIQNAGQPNSKGLVYAKGSSGECDVRIYNSTFEDLSRAYTVSPRSFFGIHDSTTANTNYTIYSGDFTSVNRIIEGQVVTSASSTVTIAEHSEKTVDESTHLTVICNHSYADGFCQYCGQSDGTSDPSVSTKSTAVTSTVPTSSTVAGDETSTSTTTKATTSTTTTTTATTTTTTSRTTTTTATGSEGVTVGDTSVWCYIGTASGSAVTGKVYYNSDVTDAENQKYATPNEALDAAFNDYADGYSSTDTTRVYLNQDITFTTPYTVEPTTTGKTLRLYMDGFTLKFIPEDSATYANSSAFKFTKSAISGFSIDTGAQGEARTFTPYLDNPFFETIGNSFTLSLNNDVKGDLYLKNMTVSLNYTDIDGNLTSDGTSYFGINRSVVVNGNIHANSFIQINAGGALTVNGDLYTSRSIQAQKPIKVSGNLEASADSSNKYALQTQSYRADGSSVGGDLICHGNNETGKPLDLNSTFTVGGKTIIDGRSASLSYQNCTFGGGIIVNTDNVITVTLDETDKVGAMYYDGDELYTNVISTYGTELTAPQSPTMSGYDFVGWTDKDGNIVDISAETQGIYNAYYALFAQFADETITPNDDNTYLPVEDMMTKSGKKVVCYKTSNGDLVDCGTKAVQGETYTAVCVEIKTQKGAQVRIKSVDNVQTNGLRFLTNVSNSDISALQDLGFEITEIGTKIAPNDYIESGKTNYVKAVADYFYSENGENSVIAGSIVKLKDSNLNRDFFAEGYVTLSSSQLNRTITVTAENDDNVRSIYTVASRAFLDQESYTNEQNEIIKSYLDSVVIIKDEMIECPKDYVSPYMFTGTKVAPNTEQNGDISKIKLIVNEGVKYFGTTGDNALSEIVTSKATATDLTSYKTNVFYVGFNDDYGTSKTDKCGLILPKTYSDTGKPTRLIISCHGHNGNVNNFINGWELNSTYYFVHQGYAVLYVEGGNVGYYNMGSSSAVRSNVAAYNFLMQNYNLYSDVFVKGNSMGGLTSTNLVSTEEIPVIAQIGDAPILSLYRQGYCYGWTNETAKNVAKLYNFSLDEYNTLNDTSYTLNNYPFYSKEKDINDSDRQLFQLNFADKVVPLTHVFKHCSSFFDYETKTFKDGYTDYLTATDETRVTEIYNNISIDYPVPIKIWHATSDGTVQYKYSQYFCDAVNRGTGANAEIVSFSSAQHCNIGNTVTVDCLDGASQKTNSSALEMYEYMKSFE